MQSADDVSEFEFPCISRETDTWQVTADEIFENGQIRPVFKDWSTGHVAKPPVKSPTTRVSLGRLFSEDRDYYFSSSDPPSCSSSEAEDPTESYCPWTPRKSGSTGTCSRRWRLPSLLRRCNSEGRDAFVFLSNGNADEGSKKKNNGNTADVAVKRAVSYEEHYKSKRAERDGNRRRSYLPYKQDLVGLFGNISRFNRSGGGAARNIHTL